MPGRVPWVRLSLWPRPGASLVLYPGPPGFRSRDAPQQEQAKDHAPSLEGAEEAPPRAPEGRQASGAEERAEEVGGGPGRERAGLPRIEASCRDSVRPTRSSAR